MLLPPPRFRFSALTKTVFIYGHFPVDVDVVEEACPPSYRNPSVQADTWRRSRTRNSKTLYNSPVKKSRFGQATSDATAMISAATSASNTATITTVIASAV